MVDLKRTGRATAVAGLLAAALAALAQTTTPEPRRVTRDELRACMNSEGELVKRREGLDARRTRVTEEATAIRSEGEELTAEHKRLEEGGSLMSLGRDRFERKARQHNARLAAARQEDEAVRAGYEGLKQAIDAHNAKCSGITFDPADKDAILKEQGK